MQPMNNTEQATEVEFGDDGLPPEPQIQLDSAADLDKYLASVGQLRVAYQTSHYFLPQIHNLIKGERTINIRPEYQRRLRWTPAQKSALIESMLLNIPIPPIYLYETEAARYEVMDGQQRLNAILEFLEDDLTLAGLTVLSELNGLKYSLCSPGVRRALARVNVAAIVLLMESDLPSTRPPNVEHLDLRRLVFDRLNTGGRSLNPQEIRNALNPGPLNDAVIRMTRLPIFTTVFDIPPYDETNPEDAYESEERQRNTLYKSMKDCELALRFVALRSPDEIRGAMKHMLDRAMKTNITAAQADTLVDDYRLRLQFLHDLFEQRPFRLGTGDRAGTRIYAGTYDAAMVAIDQHWASRRDIRAAAVRRRLNEAVRIEQQYELLTGRRNTADAVRQRIELFKAILLPNGA